MLDDRVNGFECLIATPNECVVDVTIEVSRNLPQKTDHAKNAQEKEVKNRRKDARDCHSFTLTIVQSYANRFCEPAFRFVSLAIDTASTLLEKSDRKSLDGKFYTIAEIVELNDDNRFTYWPVRENGGPNQDLYLSGDFGAHHFAMFLAKENRGWRLGESHVQSLARATDQARSSAWTLPG